MSSSGMFRSFYSTLLYGGFNVETDEVGVMLVGAGYRPDLMRHTRRSDISELAIGGGYDGPVKTTVEMNHTDRGNIELKFCGGRWVTSSIAPAGAIYFVARGGEASEDELLCWHSFGKTFACTNGTFVLAPSIFEFK
jgi:hypothetical protein